MNLILLKSANDFPDLRSFEDKHNGLIAVGGNLDASTLIKAYSLGIFPWYNEGQPICWWSLDPRLILEVKDFKVSHSLAKLIKKNSFQIKCNTAFKEVIKNCAVAKRLGQDGTWINQEVIDAYCNLHELSYAVSIETYLDEKLVGGLYGINIDNVFFGESMFSLVSDASKLALHKLVEICKQKNIELIDCQQETKHLISLGARPWPRRLFVEYLHRNLKDLKANNWLGI